MNLHRILASPAAALLLSATAMVGQTGAILATGHLSRSRAQVQAVQRFMRHLGATSSG